VLYEQVEIDALYAGYMPRQKAEIESFRKDENLVLSDDIDYMSILGLSNEAREKLHRIRPQTLGQAGRIEGMTQGALTTLLFYVRNQAKLTA
jgi:tRNA uridine 5-carboxymethylaminomethyl modification enzyme